MILDEPYNSWLIKNVGENLDDQTRFLIKVKAATSKGVVAVDASFDLTWFLLLHSNDAAQIKLDVALALLEKKGYKEQFNITLKSHAVKRLIAEFLLFNPVILLGLKDYIDFTLLNLPLDFITHALLIKLNADPIDSSDMTKQRLAIVNAVLDTGFSLPKDISPNSEGVALNKILSMDIGDEKFTLCKRLLAVGYHLFGDNSVNNNEIACTLINNREKNDCFEIITLNKDGFKNLVFNIAGTSGSNIADYYYWVKEDIHAVEFIRKNLNLDITP